MGESNDDTSVVDVDGRLHGVEGLDVVGNAVVPTRLAVNPTLTAVRVWPCRQRSRSDLRPSVERGTSVQPPLRAMTTLKTCTVKANVEGSAAARCSSRR